MDIDRVRILSEMPLKREERVIVYTHNRMDGESWKEREEERERERKRE